MGADVIEEVSVVRNDKHGAEIVRQKILQPADSVDIEVVCRLVEHDDIGVAEKRLCKQHLDLLVTAEG